MNINEYIFISYCQFCLMQEILILCKEVKPTQNLAELFILRLECLLIILHSSTDVPH